MANDPLLARVELTFKTTDDARALGERIREAVALIVGREALEEFRLRTLPLSEKQEPR